MVQVVLLVRQSFRTQTVLCRLADEEIWRNSSYSRVPMLTTALWHNALQQGCRVHVFKSLGLEGPAKNMQYMPQTVDPDMVTL